MKYNNVKGFEWERGEVEEKTTEKAVGKLVKIRDTFVHNI